jgi:hypothetical protein
MVQAPNAPGTYVLQALSPSTNDIKASVSPYRDSTFPLGITPAGQPSRHSFDFPVACPGAGGEDCTGSNRVNYPVTLATIVVSGAPKSMSLPNGALPVPSGLPSVATMLGRTPDKVRKIVFELCGGATGFQPQIPDLGNFRQFVNIPSCGWYFAKYNAMYWGGTPFTTLLLMRDADDVGVPSHDPNMPLVNFKKEGLFDATQPLFPDMFAGNYEEWTVYNRSFSTHPWHLHQNHVLITKINGVALPTPEWHDTLLVPAASAPCPGESSQTAGPAGRGRRAGPAGALGRRPVAPPGPNAPPASPDPTVTCIAGGVPGNDINVSTPGSITFRVFYNPVTVGCFVAHCHIIDHEDLGMMQRFDVKAAGGSSNCALDVAEQQPNSKQRLAMRDGFEICFSPALAGRKPVAADTQWWKPDLR